MLYRFLRNLETVSVLALKTIRLTKMLQEIGKFFLVQKLKQTGISQKEFLNKMEMMLPEPSERRQEIIGI